MFFIAGRSDLSSVSLFAPSKYAALDPFLRSLSSATHSVHHKTVRLPTVVELLTNDIQTITTQAPRNRKKKLTVTPVLGREVATLAILKLLPKISFPDLVGGVLPILPAIT